MTPGLPLVGQELGGYRLQAVLARGGMGVIYEAESPRLGTTVALKVLAPELSADDMFRTRFLRESRMAASLNHPNVLPIFDTGAADDLLYIAMRYVHGADLRAVLTTQGRLTPTQALPLITQVGRALDAAHREGLVHRDVKPANILVEHGNDDEPDHVYLADFGVTKHASSTSGLTQTGHFVGTIDYIAPEQIQSKHVDGRADLYSLGCVLYECLAGQPPFVREVDAAVLFAHLTEPPPSLHSVRPELPEAIDEVIARALAKDPEQRYPTCREFLTAVRAVFERVPQTFAAIPTEGTIIEDAASSGTSRRSAQPTEPRDVIRPTELQGAASPATSSSPAQPTQPHDVVPPTQLAGAASPGTSSSPAQPTQPRGGAPPTQPHGDASPETSSSSAQPTGPPARKQRLGRYRWALIGLLLCLAGGAAAVIVLTSSGSSTSHTTFSAAAQPVPTNRVTGGGTATVVLKGNVATVTVHTHGLVDQLHWMHIHGGTGICPTASSARRQNGHLFISAAIGDSVYGPPVTSLTTSGDSSVQSHLDLTRYQSTGSIDYTRTINVGVPVAKEIRDGLAVIVIHGINYDGKAAYDNYLGLGEERGAPALCGLLSPGRTTSAQVHPSRGTVYYTVSLMPYSSSEASQLARLRWLCHGAGAKSVPSPNRPEVAARRPT